MEIIHFLDLSNAGDCADDNSMDALLVEKLTQCAEPLLKRPGSVSVAAVRRLAALYGFDTWLETREKDNGRVSLSNTPRSILSPMAMSPAVGRAKSVLFENDPQSRLTLNLDRVVIDIDYVADDIQAVSVSVGTDSEATSLRYDFIKGWDGSSNAGDVLLANLTQNATLDAFNMNLRVLYMLDRLSKQSPNDIFSIFSMIVDALMQQKDSMNYELISNLNDKVGVFLKYWKNDQAVNEWIKSHKNVDVPSADYCIHFKVKEPKSKDHFKIEEKYFTSDVTANDKVSSWYENSKWSIPNNPNVKESLSQIQLEFLPPIWVPEDLLKSLDLQYRVIDQSNENWADNTKHPINDKLMDRFYHMINENSSALLDDTEVGFDLGCKMVKLFKIQGLNLPSFNKLTKSLRSWTKLNSMISKLLEKNTKLHTSTSVSINENDNNDEEIKLSDLLDALGDDPMEGIKQNDNPWVYISINNLNNSQIHVETSKSKFTICDGVCNDQQAEVSESFMI